MRKTNKTRRDFLVQAAGIATASLSWPYIFVPKKAFAAPSGLAGPSGGAIFIMLNGGARTQCVFNGAVGMGTNPFGAITSLPVPVSATLTGTGIATNAAINRHLNLLTTTAHHNRSGNHDTGRITACTGYDPNENKPGILTILNYMFQTRLVPCVNIGNDTPTTNIGSEISSTFSPIKIGDPRNVADIVSALTDVQVSPAETARMLQLRDALQDRYLRTTKFNEPADIPFFQRRALLIAQQLSDDALNITRDANMGQYLDSTPVANSALRTAFGVTATGGGNSLGAQAMLALRLRQLGCAGITISSNNWDMHSNELQNMPANAVRVGQAISGLIDNMSRIRDINDPSKTLLETTVITVLTDFNRGNWSVGTGFNGTQGSDHSSGEDKTAFQCIPIIGGGLPGGRVLGAIRGDGSPEASSPRFQTRQVLATVLDLMGVPPTNYFAASVTPLTGVLTSG